MDLFQVYHYQIVVHLSSNSPKTSGFIKIDLRGERRDVEEVELKRKMTKFQAGNSYTYLLTYPKPLGPVKKAKITWKVKGVSKFEHIFQQNPPIVVDKIQVNYMSNIDKE